MRVSRNTTRRILKGMTLIEMLMAIFILTIGMIGVDLLFVNSWKNNKFILEMGNASLIASHSVNAVAGDLRKVRQADNGSYPLVSGDGFSLTAYLDIDNDGVTERVHYYLDNGALYRGVTEPATTMPVSYPSGDQTVVKLADYISNTGSDPLFQYYNRDYPSDTVHNPLATPVAVQNVQLVKIHLLVNIDPVNAPNNINIESFVELRNINHYGN